MFTSHELLPHQVSCHCEHLDTLRVGCLSPISKQNFSSVITCIASLCPLELTFQFSSHLDSYSSCYEKEARKNANFGTWSLSGSMESAKSPMKKKRLSLKDHIDQAEPYEVVAPTLKPTFTWIEEATLMGVDIRMYQGTFNLQGGRWQPCGDPHDSQGDGGIHQKTRDG